MTDRPEGTVSRGDSGRPPSADFSWIGAPPAAVGDATPAPELPNLDRPSGLVGERASALRASEPAAPGATDKDEPAAEESTAASRKPGRRRPAVRRHLWAVPDLEPDESDDTGDAESSDATETPPSPAAAPAPNRPTGETPAGLEVMFSAPPALPHSPPPLPLVRRRRRSSDVLSLVVIAVIGTAVALGVDAWIGYLDGLPPAYLLIFLALPTWDLLPGRLISRLAVVMSVAAVTVAGWLGLAALPVADWLNIERGAWRNDVAFGLACLGGGLLHLLVLHLMRRRRPAGP